MDEALMVGAGVEVDTAAAMAAVVTASDAGHQSASMVLWPRRRAPRAP